MINKYKNNKCVNNNSISKLAKHNTQYWYRSKLFLFVVASDCVAATTDTPSHGTSATNQSHFCLITQASPHDAFTFLRVIFFAASFVYKKITLRNVTASWGDACVMKEKCFWWVEFVWCEGVSASAATKSATTTKKNSLEKLQYCVFE